MSEHLNHQCSICGKKYHFCLDCGNAKSFTPWRTIVDTIEHYKIFIIIRNYVNKNINKSEAKLQLNKLDLSEIDIFVPEIKIVIEDILKEEVIVKKINKKSKTHVNSIDIPKSNI